MKNYISSRLNDLAKKASYQIPSATRFLEPAQFNECKAQANAEGVKAIFLGGHKSYERAVCLFTLDDEFTESNYITRLKLSWDTRYSTLSHRDILGSLMGLGIERELIGDILVDDGRAYLFCVTDIKDYLLSQLESAGRARLTVTEDTGEFTEPEPKGRVTRITVSSNRLDAIVAHTLNLSRSQANNLIEAERVKLNHIITCKPDTEVSDNTIISVAGFGRIKLLNWTGITKKDRLGANMFIYEK